MRRILLLLLLMLLCAQPCAADGLSESLPEDSREMLEGYGEDSTELGGGLERIWDAALAALQDRVLDSLRLVGTLLTIVLLCALVGSIGLGNGNILRVTGVVAVVGFCADTFTGVFSLSEQTLTELQSFSAALLAALASSMAASGGVSAGTALYAGSAFFLNLLLQLIPALLLPLVYGYLTACTAGIAMGNESLRRVGELLKWFVTTFLKLLSSVFVAYLTITGVVSGSADSSAVKAMKLALSTAVPVVGSIISDASETVLVSAGLVKNAVGVFGMLGVLSICAVPFVRIGLRYLALKLAAALSGVVDTLGLSKLLDILSGAMGMLLAMTAVALLIMVFSCVCALRLVGA